jgi:uncharacterized membrane protein
MGQGGDGALREMGLERAVDLGRIAALSDGVFAVAMTILVANLPVPRDTGDLGAMSLGLALVKLLPQLKTAAIGFFVVALYWWRHHEFIRVLARCDLRIMWLNFLLLFNIVLTPFATRLAGAFHLDPLTVQLYAGNLALIGLVQAVLWWCAAREPGILKPEIDKRKPRRAIAVLAVFVVIFLASIPIAEISVSAAVWSWLLLIPAGWLRARIGGIFEKWFEVVRG